MYYLIIFNPERKSGCYSEEAVELSPGVSPLQCLLPPLPRLCLSQAAAPCPRLRRSPPSPPAAAPALAVRRVREREERRGGRGQREGTRESHNFFLCVNDKWVPQLGWDRADRAWGLALLVTNLQDRRYVHKLWYEAAPLGSAYATVSPGRSASLELHVGY